MKKKILSGTIALVILLSGITVFAEGKEAKDRKDDIIIYLKDKDDDKEEKPYKKLFSVSELKLYKKNDIDMVPLRPIAESLGFQVNWNKELRQVDVSKEAMSTSLKAGENYYIVARKSPVKLSEAPEIKNDQTYVPIEFFDKILKHRLMIAGDDLAIIMEKTENKEKQEELLRIEGYVKYINEMNDDISILVGVKESDVKLNDIYIHVVDETGVLNKDGEKISSDLIKIGSKVSASIPKMMTMSLPPQTTGKEIIVEDFIDVKKVEKNGLKYPELVSMENKVAKSYFDQAMTSFLEDMESNELFKDLKLDYRISYLDEEKISIIFRGTYDFLGQDKEIIKTLNMDLRSGEIIEFENYFKTDEDSQDELKKILSQATKIQHNKEFEAEGLSIYFTEDFLVVYYYELSDSVSIPTEIYLDYKDIEDIINRDIGKVEEK